MIPFSACSPIMLGVERPYQMTERRGVVGPSLLSCRRAGGQGQEKASTALSLYNDLLTTAVLGCCRLHRSNIVARSWTRHVLRFLHMSTAAVPRQPGSPNPGQPGRLVSAEEGEMHLVWTRQVAIGRCSCRCPQCIWMTIAEGAAGRPAAGQMTNLGCWPGRDGWEWKAGGRMASRMNVHSTRRLDRVRRRFLDRIGTDV